MKVLKQGTHERIYDKLQKLRFGKARRYFVRDIGYPARTKEADKASILRYTDKVERILPDIKTLLELFRKHVLNIWDQNKYCASYLLICKAFGEIKPVMTIAREGSSHEVIELVRSGVEALDLSFLFLEENDGVYLKRWLKGEIIGNDEARKMYDKIINAERAKNKSVVPLRDVKSDVYWVYSLFTHNSYSALLESVDPFYEDYDFKKYSGYHYTAKNLHLVESLILNILLSLKNAFLKLNDPKGFVETDKLMKKIGYVNTPAKDIDELFTQYRANTMGK